MIEIMCPILSITLATLGKSGTQKIITIICVPDFPNVAKVILKIGHIISIISIYFK
jgi:hypothetical protein